MKAKAYIALILFAAIVSAVPANVNARKTANRADSIMNKVFSYVKRTNCHVGNFQSLAYSKFHINTDIHNSTFRLIPHSIHIEKGKHHYFGESFTRYDYVDIGILKRKEIAFYCTMKKLGQIRDVVLSNINIFIYEPTLLTDHLLSPFSIHNKRYYKYTVDSIKQISSACMAKVIISPRYRNVQLVKGSAWIDVNTGKISSVSLNAKYDNMLHLKVNGEMGKEGVLSLLPTKLNVDVHYAFGGNHISCSLASYVEYNKVDGQYYADSLSNIRSASKHKYDLTPTGLIPSDTFKIIRSLDYFSHVRPFELTPAEDSIYQSHNLMNKKKKAAPAKEIAGLNIPLDDIILGSHYLKFNRKAMLSIPPMITPSMFEWSKSKGISIETRLKFRILNDNGRSFSLTPKLGYNFKQKQVYCRVPLNIVLFPKIGGGFEAELKNGNHIYNSLQAREVRKQLTRETDYDSLLNVFNKYNFNYYNDFSTRAGFFIEPVVGLKIHTGLVFHQRKLINWNETAAQNGLRRYYKSIAPNVNVEYTPKEYYYRNNHNRVPLYSYWPTFRLSYERGERWWTCKNRYERWEADATYLMKLHGLRSLYLRGGGGFFTDRKEIYFVDYNNFSYQNMPMGWNDDMTGEFQLLDRRWYNESNYYMMLCSTYESPMLFFSRFTLTSRLIRRERIYVNAVCLHALNPYIECGYGVSTNYFDGAVFMGAANNSGLEFGAKISLRFFDDW